MGWEIAPATSQTTAATPEYKTFFDRSFNEASKMLDTGGIAPYSGQRYAGLNDQQRAILDQTINRGTGGNPLVGAAQNGLMGMASGQNLYSDPAYSGFNFLSGAPGASSEAQDMLRQTASGAMIGQNPYLQDTYNRAAEGVTSGVQSSFARGGRLGSGLATRALGDSLGGLANQIYGGAYQNERANQLAAQQQMGNMSLQDRQQQLAALQGLSGTFQGQQTNQIRSAALSPTFAAQDLTNLQAGLNAAGAYQSDAQNQLTTEMNKYYEGQKQPYNALSAYNSFLSGLPYASTQTNSGTPSYYSTAANVLGGIGGAASIYNSLGGYNGIKDIYNGVSGLLTGSGGPSSMPNTIFDAGAMTADDLLASMGF
jgi:hypothetical protein